MMKYYLFILSFLLVSLQGVSAQEADEEKVSDMYAFGYVTSLNDSVVYLTEIAQMPEVYVNKKTGFLANRASYTSQLKEFATKLGVDRPTCAIIFNRKKPKLAKIFVKMTNKFQKKKRYFVKAISSQEFTFKEITQ